MHARVCASRKPHFVNTRTKMIRDARHERARPVSPCISPKYDKRCAIRRRAVLCATRCLKGCIGRASPAQCGRLRDACMRTRGDGQQHCTRARAGADAAQMTHGKRAKFMPRRAHVARPCGHAKLCCEHGGGSSYGTHECVSANAPTRDADTPVAISLQMKRWPATLDRRSGKVYLRECTQELRMHTRWFLSRSPTRSDDRFRVHTAEKISAQPIEYLG